ncbi:MAG: ABC transporter ATP-binding protein [Firmicutes bacterium]|nr:ABC transporter ATP-binding protein [Bacillota bacterium]
MTTDLRTTEYPYDVKAPGHEAVQGPENLEKIVEIRNLSYTYPDGTRALNNVSLDVYTGQSVGIVGPNGAGKSTLLLNLGGILRGEGIVNVLGLPVNRQNLRKIRSRIGYVFQNPDDQLFCPTVFDDVAFGPLNQGLSPAEASERVRHALASVGMDGFERRLPHHLSYGEKKRIALATVLSMNPSLLILDEPFEGLDLRGKRGLHAVLQEIGLAKILVGHDLDFISELCTHIIILDRGEVVAHGETHEIISDRDLLESHGVEWPRAHGPDVLSPKGARIYVR